MKPVVTHARLQRRRNRGGFALTVTLTLMVLLAILALGLLSLSSVSLRTISRSDAEATARANARLALQLAIGQLQAELGPDQRISAPATLLEAPATPHQSRKYWTAVYDSWAETQTARPAPAFRNWLVSQDSTTSPDRTFASAAPDSDSVTVFSHGTEQVVVPKIAAPGGTGTGAVAWWTSDDNQKATLLPPPENTDPGAGLRALAMSGGNGGFPLIETDGEKPFAAVVPADFGEGSAATYGQTALLVGADAANTPGAFPHLTTNAGGLLTNVRKGGFRKDLSVYFERDMTAMPDTALYKGDGVDGGAFDVAATDPGSKGITWRELWAFHNLPKRLSRGYSKSFTTGGTPSTDQDFILSKTGDQILEDPWFRYPHPSHVRYQAVVSLWAEKTGDPAENKYQLYYVIDPIVTVWNPFDVAVSFSGVYNSVKYWTLPYDFEFSPQSGGVMSAPMAQSVGNSAANANYVQLRVGYPDEAIMRPGEVLVYSQASGGTPTKITSNTNGKINGKKSWNQGGGLAYPISVRAKGASGAYTDYVVEGNAGFNYDIRPNNRRAVSGGSSYALTMNDFWIYEAGPSFPAPQSTNPSEAAEYASMAARLPPTPASRPPVSRKSSTRSPVTKPSSSRLPSLW